MIHRFEQELDNTTDDSRKEQLEEAINQKRKEIEIYDNKSLKVDDIIEKKAYMQPWRKLSMIYKKKKMIEYIEEEYGDDEDKEIVKKLLLEGLEKGLLSKDKEVIYDVKTCKIKNVKKLDIDDDDNYYLKNKI
jgi:hypothetical protein